MIAAWACITSCMTSWANCCGDWLRRECGAIACSMSPTSRSAACLTTRRWRASMPWSGELACGDGDGQRVASVIDGATPRADRGMSLQLGQARLGQTAQLQQFAARHPDRTLGAAGLGRSAGEPTTGDLGRCGGTRQRLPVWADPRRDPSPPGVPGSPSAADSATSARSGCSAAWRCRIPRSDGSRTEPARERSAPRSPETGSWRWRRRGESDFRTDRTWPMLRRP